LLSVLGSQGDAGQFRTPRHIIEFMVNIIEPKKNETILDPACGTAGFLISSYKHIAEKNSKDGKNGANLTPDDRNKLAENIIGYDISPDMVRLSLVNMYLHGFRTPNIFEYDTLTSEDRWNEYFDIVLANPPFMSPKGGIKPHKRFSVQSNRSEVLFVDYIAEHLAPTGRAAVIVPEGIIFQSQNAYKQLRKMLIEKCLYAVVSLPAGVFNPYSGVKTSILLMDKNISKRTDKILFVKIENDGFDLGAQRRPIKQNDIPQSLSAIKEYYNNIYSNNNFDIDIYSNLSLVEKTKIAEDGDFCLTCDRYREQEIINSKYKLIEIQKICEIVNDKPNIFENEKKYTFIECKYHNRQGIYCGSKDILYTWARFLDLQDGFKSQKNFYNFTSVWLITNTKFSDHAKQFGLCKKMGLLGWNWPENGGLAYYIKKAKFWPITILSNIDNNIRKILFKEGIILISDLLKPNFTLKNGKISQKKISIIQEEAQKVMDYFEE